MKITNLEMGLMKIQAETKAESQAICGILEILFHIPMPDAVCNHHGMDKKGRNYCLIPNGSMTGDGAPGIKSNIKKWKKLPWNYQFKK